MSELRIAIDYAAPNGDETCAVVHNIKTGETAIIPQWLAEALQDELLKPKSFSEQIARQTVEETNLDDPHFKGDTYEKEIDQKALSKDLFKVFGYMVAHEEEFLTDVEIADATGAYLPSIPRFRCYLKSPEYGMHNMIRRRRVGSRLFEHRILPNRNSLLYSAYVANTVF